MVRNGTVPLFPVEPVLATISIVGRPPIVPIVTKRRPVLLGRRSRLIVYLATWTMAPWASCHGPCLGLAVLSRALACPRRPKTRQHDQIPLEVPRDEMSTLACSLAFAVIGSDRLWAAKYYCD